MQAALAILGFAALVFLTILAAQLFLNMAG